MIDEKTSYLSSWLPPLDYNTARRYSPCSPVAEVGEVMTLSHGLIYRILSYCDNVIIGILGLVIDEGACFANYVYAFRCIL